MDELFPWLKSRGERPMIKSFTKNKTLEFELGGL
jgi:hypothetical protein